MIFQKMSSCLTKPSRKKITHLKQEKKPKFWKGVYMYVSIENKQNKLYGNFYIAMLISLDNNKAFDIF